MLCIGENKGSSPNFVLVAKGRRHWRDLGNNVRGEINIKEVS